MTLALNQPCFIETPGQHLLIAQARVIELTEFGGALLCESGEQFPAEKQPAVLVAITGHRLRRIPITITTDAADQSTISFCRV